MQEAGETDVSDFHSILSETTALRQEIRLQSRQMAKSLREIDRARQTYRKESRLARQGHSELATALQEAATSAQQSCILEILEVRDTLERGQNVVNDLRRGRGLFTLRSRGMSGLIDGYDMALRRLDQMLARYGVATVEAMGLPFDPEVMRAVETRSIPTQMEGVVLEVFLTGFTRNGAVLRLAEVTVNRIESGKR